MNRRRATVLGALAVVAVAVAMLMRDGCVSAAHSQASVGASSAEPVVAAAPYLDRTQVADESQSTAAEAHGSFALRIVGGWPRAPIPGASAGPANHGLMWPANEEGLVLLDAALRTKPDWIVQHARWQDWKGTLPEPGEDGVIEIELQSGGVIEGRLTGEEVVREWRELRVLVRAEPRNHDEFSQANSTDDPWIEAVVPVDAVGSFRVQGLKHELAYSVYAGGGGCISPRPIRAVIPDATGLELEILPLWGLQIEFREPGGGPLRCDPALRTYFSYSWSMPSLKEAVFVVPNNPALSLSGIRFDPVQAPDFRTQPNLFASPTTEGLSVRCGVTLPGYARWNDELGFERARKSIPSKVVELQPLAAGWGSLELQVEGLPTNSRWQSLCQDMLLIMVPQEPAMRERDNQLSILLPPPLPTHGSMINGIPAGAYRVELYGAHDFGPFQRWGHQRHQPEVMILANGMAKVSVDLSLCGHVVFRGPTPAPVTIRRVDQPDRKWQHGGGRDDWATFSGLAPGAYEYSLTIARHPHWNQGPWTPFHVTAGNLTIVSDLILWQGSGQPQR